MGAKTTVKENLTAISSTVQLMKSFEGKDLELMVAGKLEAEEAAKKNMNDVFMNDVNVVKACLIKETEMGEDVLPIVLRPVGLTYNKEKTKTTGVRYVMLNGSISNTIRISNADFGTLKNEQGLDIVTGTADDNRNIFGINFLADIVITKTSVIHRKDTSVKYPVKYYNTFNPKHANEKGEKVYDRQPLAWQEWLMQEEFCDVLEGRTWRDQIQIKDKVMPFAVEGDKKAMVQTVMQQSDCRDMLLDTVFPSGIADKYMEFNPILEDSAKGDKDWAFPAVNFVVRVEPYNISKKVVKANNVI